MEPHDLKSIWQQQSMAPIPDRPNREIAQTVAARLENIHRKLRRRDRREIGAAIAGILVFGVWFWTVPGVLSRIGAAIIVAGSALIIIRIARAGSGKREHQAHLEMREFCASERDRIQTQIRLLQSVLWWYLAPNLVGSNLFVFGFTGLTAAGFAFLAATVLLTLILYRLNMRAAREQLVPVKNELEALLAEIDKDQLPSENT